jgi:glutamine amidotransferase
MGWNDVTPIHGHDQTGPSDPIFAGIDHLVAYYANSFVCEPTRSEVVIATTTYQDDTFPAGVRHNATWGVQFHPEKSSAPGLKLIRNFLEETRR